MDKDLYENWFPAKILSGVLGPFTYEFNKDFLEWVKINCVGSFKIREWHNHLDSQLSRELIFENQEDQVLYLLTFDEIIIANQDAAAYYCPYVPLIMTSVVDPNIIQTVKFKTRYDE